jgi:hypothetical protein
MLSIPSMQRSIMRNLVVSRISVFLRECLRRREKALDLAILVVVLEEADDGANAAGAETVGRIADWETLLVLNVSIEL